MPSAAHFAQAIGTAVFVGLLIYALGMLAESKERGAA